MSTTTVYCNLFENCSWRIFGCVQINGGRNNVVDNNVFVTSSKGVSVGGWTDRRWRNYLNSPGTRRQIEEITPIRKPPYSVKYPGITRLLENGPVNYLTRNVVVGGGAVFSGSPETIAYANRRFGAIASAERLAEDPAFRPLPRESDLGPRDTAAFRRASANDSAR